MKQVATRYAQALFDLAKERGVLVDVRTSLADLFTPIEDQRDFRLFLQSPILSERRKVLILEKLFAHKLHALVFSFVLLLACLLYTSDAADE